MTGLTEGEAARSGTAAGLLKATVARGWPSTTWLRLLLVAYGEIVCAVGAAHLQSQLPDRMILMDSRATAITSEIHVLDRGAASCSERCCRRARTWRSSSTPA